ncbi:heterokaryon incompatibility protein-domain-containing protein [Xylariaceae sp. FL1019]|nr:heterokaryon incompatibility protein-domain-containing protein [Xylariaceae sp. FL1019]
MEPFRYEPLPPGRFTRLVQLQPSFNRKEPLHCRIVQVNLDQDHESYEAVSYTWGPPEFSETLVVHDEADKRFKLLITASLASGLLRFRSAWVPRLLWADAICIDQNDSVDKGRQIPLMAQIFRSALRVLVWLGDSSQAEMELKSFIQLRRRLDRMGIETAKTREAYEHSTSSNLLPPPDPLSSADSQNRPGRNDADLVDIWNGFCAMLSQPWFNRRWIIQEVVLNPDVVLHCGQTEIGWSSFCSILQHVDVLRLPPMRIMLRSFPALSYLRKLLELWTTYALREPPKYSRSSGLRHTAEGAGARFLALLDCFGGAACTEPGDYIYALFGLSDFEDVLPRNPTSLAVFHEDLGLGSGTAPVDAARLYTALAGHIYTLGTDDDGLCQVLSQASGRRSPDGMSNILGLPSWVPDWSSPLHRELLSGRSLTEFKEERDKKQFRKRPSINNGRACLTGSVYVLRSEISLLHTKGSPAQWPKKSRRLTPTRVNWVSSPYPSGSAAASAQWLAATTRELWKQTKMEGTLEDPANPALRDEFTLTIGKLLWAGLPSTAEVWLRVFDPKNLTYYHPERFVEDIHVLPGKIGLSAFDRPKVFQGFLEGILDATAAGDSIPDLTKDPAFCWIDGLLAGRAFFVAGSHRLHESWYVPDLESLGIGPSDTIPGDRVLAFSDQVFNLRFREIVWGKKYLVRVVDSQGSLQDSQESLCWAPSNEGGQARHSNEVGLKLIGECRWRWSIRRRSVTWPRASTNLDWEKLLVTGETVERLDRQDDLYEIKWRPESQTVDMFFW